MNQRFFRAFFFLLKSSIVAVFLSFIFLTKERNFKFFTGNIQPTFFNQTLSSFCNFLCFTPKRSIYQWHSFYIAHCCQFYIFGLWPRCDSVLSSSVVLLTICTYFLAVSISVAHCWQSSLLAKLVGYYLMCFNLPLVVIFTDDYTMITHSLLRIVVSLGFNGLGR